MVALNRIYTRTGDDGSTGLIGNERRSKADIRIEVVGAVDETNAAIGLVRRNDLLDGPHAELDGVLASLQHDLFDLGADLALPPAAEIEVEVTLRITDGQVERLESEIDRFNEQLEALKSFVLPGGSAEAAQLHYARTVARRAERLLVRLRESEPVSDPSLRYLNRLSDLLFVLGRWANDRGAGDVLWVPGKSR